MRWFCLSARLYRWDERLREFSGWHDSPKWEISYLVMRLDSMPSRGVLLGAAVCWLQIRFRNKGPASSCGLRTGHGRVCSGTMSRKMSNSSVLVVAFADTFEEHEVSCDPTVN